MIVVNAPGSWEFIYAPFRHSEWHGFTLTDLVFPTFLYVVGNALSFSLKRPEEVTPSVFFKKVVKRTVLIFLIGVLLNLFPFFQRIDGSFVLKDLRAVRIWGVLQRIAVCYFLASLIIYFCTKKAKIIVISGFILISYWIILYYFGEKPDPYSLEGNAVKRLDLFLFNAKNLYKGFGIPFEPEGILSTWPAIVNVLTGYLTGRFIQKNGSSTFTLYRIVGLGLIMLAVALLWNPYFPVNKPIWTSSYVLYSLGWDFIVTGILIAAIDVYGFKKWTYFFEVFGKNPLFIYIMAWVVISLMIFITIGGISVKSIIYETLFLSWLSPINASLCFAVVYMLFMWLIAYFMERNEIYIKV